MIAPPPLPKWTNQVQILILRGGGITGSLKPTLMLSTHPSTEYYDNGMQYYEHMSTEYRLNTRPEGRVCGVSGCRGQNIR